MTEEKEKNFVSAVVYVHNAEDSIKEFLEILITVLGKHFEYAEIICVNDCSDDNSVEKIRQIHAVSASVSVTVINMGYFHGRELSMNAGVDFAVGDFVFEFDDTVMDYEPDLIQRVYKKCLDGYDIIRAVPDKKGPFTSRLFYEIFWRFANVPEKMTTERFRILSRRVINRIRSMNHMVLYRKAVYANCGLKMDTLHYKGNADKKSISKEERNYRRGLAADALILFTEVGYRFSVAMTMIMMAMTIFMSAYCVFIYLTSHPVAGWTTTILFLSAAFFGVFVILTIIVKYLQLLVHLIFRRSQYSFESIEKISN